ncbi:flagellar hook assembly protein FlgD [Peribacillus saganii]|uniref:Flagellar hook assembly protein FlgD n=1 Tax=Peribacillus saganii TaxID=2303992 RepID=A0A372LU12_9BACI|nr:flagellar hook assembly protein FlgD [Peribacillus saganii]RFU71290.1 flagellar hook assembly protein FlgD [Peribacillus saganii]
MNTNSIDPSLYLSNYQKEKRKTGTDILGKDDFMKILMTQLQNQDPSKPLEDKDFIAQMATFSTLEQITNMSKSIDNLVQMQQQNQLISYNEFIGKEVKWHRVTETDGAEPVVEEGTGVVSSIKFKDNNVTFVLEDGNELLPGNISEVKKVKSETATAGN